MQTCIEQGGRQVKHGNCCENKAFCRIPYLLRMLTFFFTVNKLYCYRGFISSLLLLCFVLFFGIQTPILHVCEASPLSPKAQQWSCGARWHDPVTQTHRRLHSDSGNRPPKQKSSIIYVQQLQPLIQCVGVTCPPLCRIDFLWVTNTAHTLYSVLHLTNLCSIIDMAFFFLFFPIACDMAQDMQLCPSYIFITIQLCWHSLHKKTQDQEVWKTWPHTLCREGRIPEVKALLILGGEVLDGPWGHWVTSACNKWAEGNVLKTVQQWPSANTACYRPSFQCNSMCNKTPFIWISFANHFVISKDVDDL